MTITKEEQLQILRRRMEEDESLPLRGGATQLVFGEGDPNRKIYFLGEAPGYWEDQRGRPFVGQAGKILDQMLEEVGLKREKVYISNIVRFRPPENRDPTEEEITAFAPYIDQEIEIINPKIIITLGRYSMGKFLVGEKISKVHGKPRLINWKGKERTIIPMFHPAAALRSDQIMKQFKEDFKIIPKILSQAEELKPTQLKLV